jgi:hypothetical protein
MTPPASVRAQVWIQPRASAVAEARSSDLGVTPEPAQRDRKGRGDEQ